MLTFGSLIVTMRYMKLLMDSDCLIKLTKAGLKDLVGKNYMIFIPSVVQEEVVIAGKEKGCADATVVEENIKNGVIQIIKKRLSYATGDEAVIGLFQRTGYNAVATDDAKLIRRLRLHNIPFILPALILFKLFQNNLIEEKTARWALDQLAPFISKDEYSTVHLLMEKLK
jgi:rRNA-processing protein FCF1